MTTSIDNRQIRNSSEEWTDAHEYTMGVPPINNVDPSAAYPSVTYSYGFSINHAATGADVDNLWVGAGVKGVDLELPATRPSTFPYNQVQKTPAGHVIGVDDTPGGERIIIRHYTGTGIDLKPDGSIVISSRKNKVEVVDGASTVIVKGEAHLVYEGNLTLSVTGDMNLNVGGDYNVNIDGQSKTSIKGSDIKRVARNQTVDVLENNSLTVLGNHTHSVMQKRTDIVKKVFETNVDDDILIRSSKDIETSAQEGISFGSNSFSAVAQNIAVIGNKGTIGGEEVEHFGKTYSGPDDGSGTKTTFYGSLVGLANEATTSQYADCAIWSWASTFNQFSEQAASVAPIPDTHPEVYKFPIAPWPIYNFIHEWNQNEVEWRMPTESLIQDVLDQMDKGIIKNKVFDTEITARTSMFDHYEGVFRDKPTIQEIRIAMRDKDFREGDVPHILVAQGLLHRDWAAGMPSDIKRVEDANATSKFGINRIGNSTELLSNKFRVRK